jgi:hypothetical protein
MQQVISVSVAVALLAVVKDLMDFDCCGGPISQ